jgi:hypothetical protein
MPQIQLSPEEVLLLREILESYLGDLRAEVHHTETFEYRDTLKHKEATLEKLLQQLQPDVASP